MLGVAAGCRWRVLLEGAAVSRCRVLLQGAAAGCAVCALEFGCWCRCRRRCRVPLQGAAALECVWGLVICRSDNSIQLQHRYQLQDAKEIATHLLQSLEIFLTASASKKGAPGAFNISIAQALPSDVLVKIGETHLADSEVITPLCNCIVLQAS